MSGNSQVGAAWKGPVQGSPDRSIFNLHLSVGIAGELPCRVVENPKRQTNGKAPSHLIFFSPFDGEDQVVGAFWPHTSPTSGVEYLVGLIDRAAFKVAALKGGTDVDFRRAEKLRVRLSENPNRQGDRSPTHFLWVMRPIPKDRQATAAAGALASAVPGEEDFMPDTPEEEIPEEAES